MTKATRRLGTSVTLATLAVMLATLGLLLPQVASAQGWLDTSWQYRRAVTVANPGATALTDHQVLITLDSSFNFAAARTDGSDIRLTSDDGTTLIPFWIERWDPGAQQASLWTKVPSITTSGTTVYLYYGNSAASSASDGSSTFPFFDDFSHPDPASGTLQTDNFKGSYEVGTALWGMALNYGWVSSYQSSHSAQAYDYLDEMLKRIKQAPTNKGFFSSAGNWVRSLTWTGSDWSGYTAHDWKYSMIMQEGALYYSMLRAQNGWTIESLDSEMQQEFDYVHANLNPDGTVIGGGAGQYEYGVILSNLALGYLYFKVSQPTLAARCYSDMVAVYGYVKSQWQSPATGPDYSITLQGFANAWKAFNDYGDTVSADEVRTIIQNYVATFVASQPGGGWGGQTGVQDHLKRDFGVLLAYDVTGTSSYLNAVKNNIDWILVNRWLPSTGALTWYGSTSDPFYECHQQWFMVAVRMLYDRTGGAYDYLAQGQQAWHFLTDNNYAHVDMYVHNQVNHGAFFSYRQVTYALGSARPSSSLWSTVGTPGVEVLEDGGNPVASLKGNLTHTDLITTRDRTFGNCAFETRVKLTMDLNNSCTPEVDIRYADNNNRYLTLLRGEALNDLFLRKYQGGAASINLSSPYNYTASVYYNYKVVANGAAIGLYLNDELIGSTTDAGTTVLTGGMSIHNYASAYPVYFDDVRVRKYVSPEPASTVGAEESQPYTLTTNAEPPEGGSVSRDLPGPSYPPGTVVSLTAMPGTVYQFDHWSDGATGTANPVEVTMDADQVVTAHFVPLGTGVVVEAAVQTQLAPAMPTPFSSRTTLEFSLATRGEVELAVYGVDGRLVRTLVQGSREAGVHRLAWDGRDNEGHRLTAGMYFARLTAGGERFTRTLIRLAH